MPLHKNGKRDVLLLLALSLIILSAIAVTAAREKDMNRFKPNQTVRINDTQSEYHKCLARVVKVGQKSYDVAVGPTTMRVVPEQLLGVRKP